jgi:hypothetical protein
MSCTCLFLKNFIKHHLFSCYEYLSCHIMLFLKMSRIVVVTVLLDFAFSH